MALLRLENRNIFEKRFPSTRVFRKFGTPHSSEIGGVTISGAQEGGRDDEFKSYLWGMTPDLGIMGGGQPSPQPKNMGGKKVCGAFGATKPLIVP